MKNKETSNDLEDRDHSGDMRRLDKIRQKIEAEPMVGEHTKEEKSKLPTPIKDIREIRMTCEKCEGQWVSPENAALLLRQREEARKIAEEIIEDREHEYITTNPLPWKKDELSDFKKLSF